TDCLETLEEIEITGNEIFRHAGGESLTLIPCLNANPAWADTVARWIQE
ncbi:MAG: ferrochelatase, partial [Pseudomonadales bacterium]|nr:ferrochelatase [Pseudomonadales bacterium]